MGSIEMAAIALPFRCGGGFGTPKRSASAAPREETLRAALK
jgi:hypothetical protein